jgi:hypothetical protein
MKRILVASILGIAASVAYGQGVINFGNYTAGSAFTTQVKWGIAPLGYSTGDVVNQGVISLYAGQGILTDSTGLSLLATAPIFTTVGYGGGWYDMATPVQIGSGYALIPASIWSGTQTVTFQVRGTSTVGSETGIGGSGLWQETPFSSGGSIAGDSPNAMKFGPLALILDVPEPSTLALAGLGAAGLLFFRKRQ